VRSLCAKHFAAVVFPKRNFRKKHQSGFSRKLFLSEIDNRELPEDRFFLKSQIGSFPKAAFLKNVNREHPESQNIKNKQSGLSRKRIQIFAFGKKFRAVWQITKQNGNHKQK